VNLTVGEAKIRQTFYRLPASRRLGQPGELRFKDTKNESSRRTVALPAAVVAELRRIQAEQQEQRRLFGDEYEDLGLVFCQPNGRPLHTGNMLRRDFHPLAATAGIPRCRFHDLRHAHVTYLAKAGVPIKVAMDRVGHADAKTTLGIYSHVLGAQDADAARAVERLLLGSDALMYNDVQPGQTNDRKALANP
jgi:integrase